MILVLILEPFDARGRVFVVGGACGCVETCYGESDVEDGCCVVLFISMSGLHFVMFIETCIGFSMEWVSLV